MSRIAIRKATVIDATGQAPLVDTTIVVDDAGLISEVGPDGQVSIPSGTQVIDGRGKHVVPGLIDANVHLVAARTPDTLFEYEGRYEELVLEAAELTLKYGVTTVFDSWGPVGPITAVRDSIRRGETVGPNIYCAGNIIGLGGPLSVDFFPVHGTFEAERVARINAVWERGTGTELASMAAEEVADRIGVYIEEARVDFVKWASTDHRASSPGVFYMLSDRQQAAIAQTARSLGKTFQAHTTTVESLKLLVDLDANVLQHGDITLDRPAPEWLLEEIVSKQLPTAALVVTDLHLEWSAATPGVAIHPMRVMADKNQRSLIKQGARLLLTTDGFAYGPRVWNHPGFGSGSLRPTVPDQPVQLGRGHVHWMEGAVERGMSRMEVLRSSTAYVAEAYGVSDHVGTIEPGKLGDLLVLDANPLDDLDAYRKISDVIKQGSVVDRDALAREMTLGVDTVEHPEA
ncbi:MAG: amidohydrolase family protein [Leucobacter sp.]